MNPVQDFIASILAATPQQGPFAVGTVATVTPGGAADGRALVNVKWAGATVPVTYADGYTPTVGHVVLMARPGPQLIILCRIVGTPPS